MRNLFTILCVLITLAAHAQSEGTFTNVNLQGVAIAPIGTRTQLIFKNGTTSKYSIIFAGNGTADAGSLNIANVTNSKGIHLTTDRVWLDLPLALGGNKIASTSSGYQLSVSGKIICTEAWVQPTASWPDYVFSKGYDLPTLASVEEFIKRNSHLPEVPSATDVEANGVNLGGLNAILLKKMEEMTLYMIKANKDVIQMQEEIAQLKLANAQLQQQLGK